MPSTTDTPHLVVRATSGPGRPRAGTARPWQPRTSCGGPLDGLTVTGPTFAEASAALAGRLCAVVQAGAAVSDGGENDPRSHKR